MKEAPTTRPRLIREILMMQDTWNELLACLKIVGLSGLHTQEQYLLARSLLRRLDMSLSIVRSTLNTQQALESEDAVTDLLMTRLWEHIDTLLTPQAIQAVSEPDRSV